MLVDEMTESDLEAVKVLSEQLGYPNSLGDIKKSFGEVSKSPSHKLLVARDSSHRVVGWIQVNVEAASILSDTRGEVTALIVDEKHRGKGIGAMLLEKAEKWLKDQGIDFVRIRSNIKRLEAHEFYKNKGYEIKKSWHLFTKNLLAGPCSINRD
jgi:GNAT superfamily N-acetyltransferase